MRHLVSRACAVVAVLVAGILAAAGPAVAVDLRFSIFHTKTDAFAIAQDKWMEAVTKKTEGRIKFKPAYAGSLFTLTEAFDAVQSGAVEVAVVAVSVLAARSPT